MQKTKIGLADLFSDPLEKAAATRFHQLVHFLEVARVIRIRNIGSVRSRDEIGQQVQVGGGLIGDAAKGGQVAVVHCHDDVEAIQVFPGDLPGADALVGDSAGLQDFPGAPMGRFPFMPTAGAGGIDANLFFQPGFSNHLTKNGFRHRRATDVA